MRPFDQVFHILKYRKHKQLVPLVDNFFVFENVFYVFSREFCCLFPMGVETKQVKITLP